MAGTVLINPASEGSAGLQTGCSAGLQTRAQPAASTPSNSGRVLMRIRGNRIEQDQRRLPARDSLVIFSL
jgi:hypothetical protein